MSTPAAPHIVTAQERLGLAFKNPRLLEQALTHRSFLNESPDTNPDSNERLEFTGDAVIGLVVAHHLASAFPHLSEGELTVRRVALVRGDTLARVAASLGLGQFLRLGSGEERRGGRGRPSILAAALEAVVGATYQDRGYATARAFTLRVLRPEMRRLAREGVPKDPKSALQEAVQARGWALPTYCTVAAEGPEDTRRFVVEVRVGDRALGRGEGLRKVHAQRAAAQEALARLAEEDESLR